jgi:hypothetical protein
MSGPAGHPGCETRVDIGTRVTEEIFLMEKVMSHRPACESQKIFEQHLQKAPA